MPTNWPPSLLGLDTNIAAPSSDSRAAYDAIQLARKKRSAEQALNLVLGTSAAHGESDEKQSQIQRVFKLWSTLRQRHSRRVSTGGPLGRRTARQYVAATLLVLLFGAGATIGPRAFKAVRQIYVPSVSPQEKLTQLLGAAATVWSKVSETAWQIYVRNLSPDEQSAQANLLPNEQFAQAPPRPTNVKTTLHRDQLAINKQPLPNQQTTKEAGGASQGGILERLLAGPRKGESPGIQGDPHAKVWVDTHTGVYLCQGTAGFGKTSQGRYMTLQQARFDGFRSAYERKCE